MGRYYSNGSSAGKCGVYEEPEYMMDMRFIFFILLFATSTIFGQPVADIQRILGKKDFISLQKHVDSAIRINSIDRRITREIAANNFESIIEISRIKPIDSTGGNVDNYTLNVLSTNEEIYYYELIKWVYVGEPLIVDSFTDSEKYQNLQRLFFNTYASPLDSKQLFQNKIVYGIGCGIVAQAPEYQEKLDSMVRNRDSKTILSWLRSPNTEKQLYAIQGLRKLQRKGYKLNDEDKNLINIISNKKGKAYTCGGCLYTLRTISEIAGHLNTQYSKDVKKRFFLNIGLASLLLLFAAIFFYRSRMKKPISL